MDREALEYERRRDFDYLCTLRSVENQLFLGRILGITPLFVSLYMAMWGDTRVTVLLAWCALYLGIAYLAEGMSDGDWREMLYGAVVIMTTAAWVSLVLIINNGG